MKFLISFGFFFFEDLIAMELVYKAATFWGNTSQKQICNEKHNRKDLYTQKKILAWKRIQKSYFTSRSK